MNNNMNVYDERVCIKFIQFLESSNLDGKQAVESFILGECLTGAYGKTLKERLLDLTALQS